MEILRNWSLPVALAAAQLAGVWIAFQVAPDPLDRRELVSVVAVTLLAAVALAWRRRAPVAAAAGVLAVTALGLLAAPPEATASAWVSGRVGLYSVAARGSRRATVIVSGVTAAVLTAVDGSESLRDGAIWLPVHVVFCVLVAAAGRLRWRWRRSRMAAAGQLARAAQAQRQAGAVERGRLARELHDITAHHLTSVVVTAGAAQRLAGRRPELVGEALHFAARVGRETVDALHHLVAAMGGGPAAPRGLREQVDDLAAGLLRLGQPVTVVDDGEPAGLAEPLVVAGHAIVREALTNALRYAPGAPVTVRLAYRPGAVEVIVEDEGAAAPATPVAPGSGRGLAGARERAVLLGGELTAGPRPGGGWCVTAALPTGGAVAPALPRQRRPWRRGRARWAFDVSLALLVVANAMLFAVVEDESDPSLPALTDPGDLALLVLLLLVQALPLLWRRRPWLFLAGLALPWLLWPAVFWLRLLPPVAVASGMLLFVVGCFVAAYSAGSFSRLAWASWLAAPVTGVGLFAAITALQMAYDPPEPRPGVVELVGVTVVGAALSTLLLLVPWGVGLAVRLRRERTLARENDAVAAMAAWAVDAARAERLQLAAGLRDSVLDHARRLVEAADAGCAVLAAEGVDGAGPAQPGGDAGARLDEVTAHARAALAAMRELLGTLRGDDAPSARGPQPSAAGIDALCRAYAVGGREVEFVLLDEVRPLPAATDVSAYRVVETALGAGDAAPARVTLRHDPGKLHITVEGVPVATDGVVVAGLRARVVAVGGELTVPAAGTLAVALPARTQEVIASSSA